MFGHRCFLKIGSLENANIMQLFKEAYELLSCSYGFMQGIDNKGKAQTDVSGESIRAVFANLPPDPLIKWMLDSRKYENGAIIICDMNDMPVEKLVFEKATCVKMNIDYSATGRSYITTQLEIQAEKITMGNVSFENHWD